MTKYTIHLRGDNSTWGIIRQYLINGEYSTSESSPHSSNPWCSRSEAYPSRSYEDIYDGSYNTWPLGGEGTDADERDFKQLLVVKTPPTITGATIKNAYLMSFFKHISGSGSAIVNIYEMNGSFKFSMTNNDIGCDENYAFVSYAESTDTWEAHPNGSTQRAGIYGTEYSATTTDYPVAVSSPVPLATDHYLFIAFDTPPDGIAYERHRLTTAGTVAQATLYLYHPKDGGTGAATILYDDTGGAGHRLNESGRMYFYTTDAWIPLSAANALTWFQTVTGDAPPAYGIPEDKYWLCLKHDTLDPGSLRVAQHIRPIYFGEVSSKQPLGATGTDRTWITDPDVASPDVDDDAFSPTAHFINSGGAPFGVVDSIVLTPFEYSTEALFLNSVVDEFNKTYFFALTSTLTKGATPIIIRTIGSPGAYTAQCFLDVEIELEDSKSPVGNLEVIPNTSDPTQIRVKWTPPEELPLFAAYEFHASIDGITFYPLAALGSSGKITDIGTQEYVLSDGTTDLDPSNSVFISNANDVTFSIKMKIHLDTTGYASGYSPYFWSNTVQAYRPGYAASTSFLRSLPASADALVQNAISFTYASKDPPDAFPLKKTILTWRDGSVSEITSNPVTTSAITGTAIHKFADVHPFTNRVDRPYVQFETEQGIRSCLADAADNGYCNTSFAIDPSAPRIRAAATIREIFDDETLQVTMQRSGPSYTSGSMAGYMPYVTNGDYHFSAGQTSPIYVFTPSAAGSYTFAAIGYDGSSPALYGSGFDWIVAYYDATHPSYYAYSGAPPYTQYAALMADDTNDSLAYIAGKYVLLMSSTPFHGIAMKLESAWTGTATLAYSDGAGGFNTLTPTTAMPNEATNIHAVLWDRPSDWLPQTNAGAGDTTSKYYIVKIDLSSVTLPATGDILVAKLTRNENLFDILVLSSTAYDLDALTDVEFTNLGYDVLESYEKVILHKDAGLEPRRRGFGGIDIPSLDGLIVGSQATGSGKYVSGSGLNSYDLLEYYAQNGLLVQKCVDVYGDVSKDIIQFFIKRVVRPGPVGESGVRPFSLDVEPKRILRYVNETLTTTPIITVGVATYSSVIDETGQIRFAGTGDLSAYGLAPGDTITVYDSSVSSYNGDYTLDIVGADYVIVTGSYDGTATGYITWPGKSSVTLTNTPCDTNCDGSVTPDVDVKLRRASGSVLEFAVISVVGKVVTFTFTGASSAATVITEYHTKLRR